MPADLTSTLEVRDSLLDAYADVLTPEIRDTRRFGTAR